MEGIRKDFKNVIRKPCNLPKIKILKKPLLQKPKKANKGRFSAT